MKRHPRVIPTLITCALALAAALPILAAEGGPCPGEAGECVDVMMEKLSQRGWVGINIEDSDDGVVLSAVVPDSPAEAAGLQKGDVLVSVNGVTYTEENETTIKEIHQSFKPGDTANIVATRNGTESEYAVTLAKLPQHILAQWVGYHMIEGHSGAGSTYEEAEATEKADK